MWLTWTPGHSGSWEADGVDWLLWYPSVAHLAFISLPLPSKWQPMFLWEAYYLLSVAGLCIVGSSGLSPAWSKTGLEICIINRSTAFLWPQVLVLDAPCVGKSSFCGTCFLVCACEWGSTKPQFLCWQPFDHHEDELDMGKMKTWVNAEEPGGKNGRKQGGSESEHKYINEVSPERN